MRTRSNDDQAQNDKRSVLSAYTNVGKLAVTTGMRQDELTGVAPSWIMLRSTSMDRADGKAPTGKLNGVFEI